MKNKKEKVPNKFSLMICLKPKHINDKKYINVSFLKECCGPTENRTRDFWVSNKRFTIKLLAHNSNNKQLNYINLFD